MKTIENILIATDFSLASRNALEFAALIAAKNRARLHVVHVAALLENVRGKELPGQAVYQEALERLAVDELEGMRVEEGVAVERRMLRGISPAREICRYAREHRCELLAVGTHGRSGISRLILGSVAEKIVRSCPVNVLVVGEGEEHRVPNTGLSCIIAPIDFSPGSRASFAEACALSRMNDATLLAVHVIPYLPIPTYYGVAVDYSEQIPKLERYASQAMDEWFREAGDDLEQLRGLVTKGPAHTRIIEAAREQRANLIVMGHSGLGGLDRLSAGSVTERVIRAAPCPTLVVRQGPPFSL